MLCCMPETPDEDIAPQKPIEGPDWSAVEFHPQCPLCEYDLFGLSAPRCPECGYAFDWADVLDPRAAEHPYLFEYHPERNVRSYFQTAWHALLPVRFWKPLHPSHPPQLRRLVLYRITGAAIYLICIMIQCFVETALISSFYLSSFNSFDNMMSAFRRAQFIYASRPGAFTIDVVVYGLLPLAASWVMLGALCVFRISMKRARIRTAHVVRCVVYSVDPSGWSATAILVTFSHLVLMAISRPTWWSDTYSPMLICGWISFNFYRLYEAYKQYLRFERSFATILAASIIVFLVYANLFVDRDQVYWYLSSRMGIG